MFKTPSFWYSQKTPKERTAKLLLLPLSWVYGFLAKKRFDLYFPVPMEKPIVCVGNLVAGGTGKTPVVLSLVEMLKKEEFNPHVLSRGYGGEEIGPLQVSPGRDTAQDVGDEPLLLVQKAPTWISSDRPLGAQAAMESGANIVVMDDGFQNPIIYKDFSIIVIDGAVGFGNQELMPAGPLREPISSGLKRANAVVIIGEDKTNVIAQIEEEHANVEILRANIEVCKNCIEVKDKKFVAFAGLGRPEKFKNTLLKQGADVIEWRSFPDHHYYKDEELEELIKIAEDNNVQIITTAKDHIRLPEKFKDKISQLPIVLVWENPEAIIPLIKEAIDKRPK